MSTTNYSLINYIYIGLEPHHQMQLSVIPRTLVGGGITPAEINENEVK